MRGKAEAVLGRRKEEILVSMDDVSLDGFL